MIKPRERRFRGAAIRQAAIHKEGSGCRAAEIKRLHHLDITLGHAVDRALHDHVKLVLANIHRQGRHTFHNGLTAVKLTADHMLVKRDHIFFSAIRHADQGAVCPSHPDDAVRLLLVGKLRHATFRDMLCQDRHVASLVSIGVDIANILKLADLAVAALQKQRNIGNLHRLCRCGAIVRILADQRACRRNRPSAGRCHHIFTARRANGKHARR